VHITFAKRETALSYHLSICKTLLDTISGPPITYLCHKRDSELSARTHTPRGCWRCRTADKRRCVTQNCLIDTPSTLISMTFILDSTTMMTMPCYRKHIQRMQKNISGQFEEDVVFPVIRVMPVMDCNTQVFYRHYNWPNCHWGGNTIRRNHSYLISRAAISMLLSSLQGMPITSI